MPGTDTIFAVSTGSLPSGVCVIRISGPRAGRALAALRIGRTASHGTLKRVELHLDEISDHAMMVQFHGPRSFTGEEVVELHLHGSRALVASVLSCLSKIDGFRHAEAGEFTRRAFINGKLTLTAAEGLAELLQAETREQLRLASRVARGHLHELYAEWRRELLHIRARIEADLDFSDEGDVGETDDRLLESGMAGLAGSIRDHLRGYAASEIVKTGFRVAVIGRPNAGKSSLINALARREVAIVSPDPGTTRDLIEVVLDVEGHKVVVSDTAGLRDTNSAVEREGIRRAHEAASRADMTLVLRAPDDRAPWVESGGNVLRIGTKADLGSPNFAVDLELSASTGFGIGSLLARIATEAGKVSGQVDLAPTSMRQKHKLEMALGELEAGQLAGGRELQAEHLRAASRHLGELIGDVDVEAVLGTIFSSFCIGK